ncbi:MULTISPECIES: hypothetical protein [Campylobacter]|uniref:Lipoprotein n=2 Tax=Campylobacter lanienae TaxID=75658 RepID=A0ABY3G863_9BACT|nr:MULTISPECIES: hypothetical protein [Campylobacter]OCS25319.1 hypothetical protein CFVB10_09095 [Campylobacter fetus subsp. venerealis cfvB10]MBC3781083.1 hypothetical protein [Campylobacter fetus subsp. fetus]MBC3782792.1 hypothetical protein [Campylobacter fetus subsp. venerealis]MDD5786347.1 hypothetical protein [Campylobacter lanienae]OCS28217.1 hypothetical protein CFV33872_04425 [Campylobacter fetus subsp. venerealis CCUG 33872]
MAKSIFVVIFFSLMVSGCAISNNTALYQYDDYLDGNNWISINGSNAKLNETKEITKEVLIDNNTEYKSTNNGEISEK